MTKHPPMFLILLLILLPSGCSWANKNFYDRLLFVEESHIGLKAKVGIDHTPGDIDFGYRRSVMALIPKADAAVQGQTASERKKVLDELAAYLSTAKENAQKEAKTERKSDQETAALVNKAIQTARNSFIADRNTAIGESPDCPGDVLDRSEPLSVISSFNADVRWFESTRVRTYFATGIAATRTACDVHAIKALISVPNE